MPYFKVEKKDLEMHPDFEKLAFPFCQKRIEDENHVTFEPKPGYLATFGVLLTERRISYKLEFDGGLPGGD